MKRVLCVLLLALTVPVLLIPASAAEEYIFEWVNPEVMPLDDSFVFEPEPDAIYFYFEGYLPEGTYDVSLSVSDAFAGINEVNVLGPLVVAYEDLDGELISAYEVPLEIVDVVSDFRITLYADVYIGQFGTGTLLAFFTRGNDEPFLRM